MEKFTAKSLIHFLDIVEKLKSVPRHCVTADGITENVAAHSWRVALMALLLKDEVADVDINKVIRMCLIHDLGEAVTGDIPTFDKTQKHEEIEKQAVDNLLKNLPDGLYREFRELFGEMDALETREAKFYKALDKLEAVIQHNESDPATWLPLEFDLQKTYAAKSVLGFPFLEALQDQLVEDTDEIIAEFRKREEM